MSTFEDIGYGAAPRGQVPSCCRWGYSEEGFVHQWLDHFDERTKDAALRLAEDGSEPWARWVKAALKAEAA